MTSREDLERINSSATTTANLPAVILPRSIKDEGAMLRFCQAVQAHLQARQGARSPYERAATMRDLEALANANGYVMQVGSSGSSAVFVTAPAGATGTNPFDTFAERLRSTRLFKDVMARLDDTARFSDLPDAVQQLLLAPLSQLAQQRGADIQRIEQKVQDTTHSISLAMTELTAAFNTNTAGVRAIQYAYADSDRAVSGAVTAVTARLDDFGGGTSSVETVMSAIASRTTGLEAQYTMKVNAGGAFAAIGLGATSSTAGVTDSHIIFVADNFAFVKPTDVIGTGGGQVNPTNPGASRIPFGIDSAGVIYLNGTVRITANGRELQAQNAHAYGTSGSWVDATANTALAALTGSTVKKIGDTVTLSNGSTFWQEKYWSGSAWVDPGVIINGNLLVGGTISGVNINLTGNARFNGAYNGADGFASVYANESGSNAYGLVSYSGSIGAIFGKNTTTNGIGVYGFNLGTGGTGVLGKSRVSGTPGVSAVYDAPGPGYALTAIADASWIPQGSAFLAVGDTQTNGNAKVSGQLRAGGTANTDAAVIGYGVSPLHGGRFHSSLGRAGFIGSGSAGVNWNFYSDGTGGGYGPFTGAHDALILKDTPYPEVGDIVVDILCLRHADVSNTVFQVALSSAPNQKAALGVAIAAPEPFDASDAPAALRTWIDVWHEDGTPTWEQMLTAEAIILAGTHDLFVVNAVGEGQINVCGEGGDIEAGDLIVTSSTPGKGMRQADDLVRGYTVAKARESVVFASPGEVKMIACIYLSG